MKIDISLFLTRRFWLGLLAVIVIAAVLFMRSAPVQTVLEGMTPPALPKIALAKNTVSLAQNWDPAVTERFHFISQGTSTLPVPYAWFTALEQPESSFWGLLWPSANDRFIAPDYLNRYGFIPAAASKENPDGLPIGFAKTPFQTISGYPNTTTSIGLTCAACHTGRLNYEGTDYIVNGGPATVDLQLFSGGLGAALAQTVISSKLPLPNRRFDRFARNVLGDSYNTANKAKLASELLAVVAGAANASDAVSVVEGFGRLDALNRIGNQVFANNVHRPENYVAIEAPVNFPHIWTTSWFDWVQYDGSIMQPLIRNSGEAVGVAATINMTAPIGAGRFDSAIPVENLKWIEDSLSGGTPPYEKRRFDGLHAPSWPETFGPIDTALASEGGDLYQKHCAGCHLPPLSSPAIWSDRYFQKIAYEKNGQPVQTTEAFLALNIIELDHIGTDPAQANVLTKRTVNTAGNTITGAAGLGLDATVCVPRPDFAGKNPRYALAELDSQIEQRSDKGENKLVEVHIKDGPTVSFALALGAIVQQTNQAWFDTNFVPKDIRPYFEGERPNCLQKGAGYKARPLNGVWATAPFLHNGSVPTLDDLLRPADERPRFVRLGSTEFDPKKVGLAQGDWPKNSYPPYVNGYFVMDTSIPGNLNTGHAFGKTAAGDSTGVIGPKFTNQQRMAIIEFLKTL